MNMFNNILIPTDGSDYANEAVTKALQLAKIMNAQVTAMSVVDTGSLAHYKEWTIRISLGEFDYDQTGAKDAVEKVSKEGSGMGVNVKTIVKNGSPAHEIIEEVKEPRSHRDELTRKHRSHSSTGR